MQLSNCLNFDSFDFSDGFPTRELYQGLTCANEQIQQLKIENQQREQYFQTLLEHVVTGIITFNTKGFILHANPASKNFVKLNVSIDPPGMELLANENLISQVLLNLLKNALEAISGSPASHIQLVARYFDNKRPELCVIDNGPGIPEEIVEQIFVPFFTTRENGSGIGLSLSRQIMRLRD